MTSLLSTGSSALLAFQRALGTVSNNVANATTEGYSRQRVSLAARVGNNIAAGVGNSGQGVDVAALQRLADGLVFARQVDSSGEVGRLTSLSSMAGRVDTLLSDSSTGLSTPMSAFFDAARGVSSDPTSTSAREALLAAARSLAGRFNSLDGQLSTIDDETNQNLSDKVGQANQLAKEIADLNKTIASSGANASSELLDARDLRVTKLAGLIGATTVQQTDGSLSVFTTGGQPLVIGAKASTLTALQDPDQPGRLQVGLDAGNGTPVRLPDASISGELGGLLQFRTNVLDPARNELGRLATGVALAFNQAQANGVDYNGQIGADLFKLAAPAVAPNAANTGSASLTATIGDVSQLTGSDIVLRYSGSGWTAQRADTGATVPMSGDGSAGNPFVVQGVSLVLSGSAAAGDKFTVRPTTGAAGSLTVAMSDPTGIAAAGAISASAATSNLGKASVASTAVTSASAFASFSGAHIEFIDDTTYTINGGSPQTYSGGAISDPAGGWSITLKGTPTAGDSFSLAPTPARSSSNANAQAFSTLDTKQLLSGGTQSLTMAMSQLTAKAGTEASHAQMSLEAQQTIDAQVSAERESVSGVNLDEEAADMMKFQQAYQAAAQVLKTADTLFQTLLSAVAR
ncbi:flagellar hook-associated protein FlgK [Pseudoxanthomonas winnipegensis]|uniref:Flagellar hook-associated protein 1 n=1 Tax=Pseudoxanthomonas winnipegensis TaxID=2480810 RepID=A0A4Q8M6F4_9GAMM|nr:flagellar hook-associated protein FlgK [Pseudoxanthomonas winnipegensis]TAA45303.1 flagellar hook-associated protein FlgK [Pseudoxanthomonas winnipegensis]